MGEHTPGPWEVYAEPGRNVMDMPVDLEVVAADGFPVAKLPLMAIRPDYPERTGHSHWAHGPGEAFIERDMLTVVANANLIAAAPRLLGTLEDVESFFTPPDDECDGCDDCSPEEMCGYHAILADVRAAIAKARGESNG